MIFELLRTLKEYERDCLLPHVLALCNQMLKGTELQVQEAFYTYFISTSKTDELFHEVLIIYLSLFDRSFFI